MTDFHRPRRPRPASPTTLLMASALALTLALPPALQAADGKVVTGFRRGTVTIYDAQGRDLQVVPATNVNWMIGTELQPAGNGLYSLQFKNDKIFLAPNDFMTSTGQGMSVAELCSRIPADDKTYARSSGFSKLCN